MKTMTPKHFLRTFFSGQATPQDFNCIVKANEDEEDGVANAQEMKYEKQGQPLPQSSASDRCGDRWTLESTRSVRLSRGEGEWSQGTAEQLPQDCIWTTLEDVLWQTFLFYVKVYVCGKARIMASRRLGLSGDMPLAEAEELSWENTEFIGPQLILSLFAKQLQSIEAAS